jgi:predicted nucleic acid-binding protein
VTLYLDTSSLVKLYVEEKGSPDARRWPDFGEAAI